MAELNLPNIREGGNIRFGIGLEDGGVAVDWSGLEDIRVFLYADAQKQVSGEMCEVAVDEEDNTVLKCKYSGDDVQYRGINSVLVRAKYLGEIKVYDKPAINIVARTSDATGVVEIDDPVVPVQISVEDVSTSLLNNAIDAAINAAAEAEKAAHLVPLQVLEDCVEATGKALEAASKAPYIDETTGNWFVWDAEAGEYVDSGKTARGATGNGIASWSVVESSEDAGNNVVTVTFTDGTSESFNVKNGHTGNGIASIVQTVESPDDAGTNVITITMTNGTVVTFNVKNGSKGTPGVAQAAYKSVSSLPTASAQTMDKIYLTPSGTSGVYNMSYTEFDGSAYSWQDLGTTAIQLSDYATKAELDQLEAKVDEKADTDDVFETITPENPNLLDINNLSIGGDTGADITYSVANDEMTITNPVNTNENLFIKLPNLSPTKQYTLEFDCTNVSAQLFLYYTGSTYEEIPQDNGHFALTFTGGNGFQFMVRLRSRTCVMSNLSLVEYGVLPYQRYILEKLSGVDEANLSPEFKGKIDSIVKDKAEVDYGIKAGYALQFISGNSNYVASYNDGVLHIDKTGATGSTFRIVFKGLKLSGSYTIHFKSTDGVSSSLISLVNGNTTLEDGSVVDNECTFAGFSYDGTYELGLSFGMKYNVASQDFIVTIKQDNVSGFVVVADNISERVAILEEGGRLEKVVNGTNTFVGKGSGKKNTPVQGDDNGHYNTALGERAMEYNTLGDHSTAVGFCALNKNTSGRNNTAIGEDALYENLTGGQNVAVGQHSGQNSQGGYNVFIGSNVARHLASGNLNVIIGAEAYNDALQTGCSNVILIGAYVSNPGNYDGVISINGEAPTAAKQIRIGKADFSAFIIGNKKLNFNQDGTVTWTDVTPTP